jgi:hypothetical protein
MTRVNNNLDKRILDLCINGEIILNDKNYYFFKLYFLHHDFVKHFQSKATNYFQSKGGEIYEDFKKALDMTI